MPDINSIPYESAEDLNKYIYDNFLSSEQIETANTGTGIVSSSIMEMELNTGVTANSSAMAYYDLNYFNPLYGEAVWKIYLNSMQNVKAFWGFKESTAAPIFPSEGQMVESHSGFMLDWQNGAPHLYASVADGYTQQKVEIYGIDLTKVENYKIQYNKFSIMPLPVIEEELGLPAIYSVERVWKEWTTLSDFPPKNAVHWIVQYVKNITGETKYLKINRFIYKEVYAD